MLIMRPWVVFDIETAERPLQEIPPCPDSFLNQGMGNRVAKDKIDAKRNENKAKWIDNAPVDPRKCQITAAGFLASDDTCITKVRKTGDAQKPLLEWMWDQWREFYERLGEHDVVGFYIRTFDLPILISRSAELAVEPSRSFDMRRYSINHGVIDWAYLLSWERQFDSTGWGLDEYSNLYGLGKPHSKGESIITRWWEGDYKEVDRHLTNDLERTARLHRAFAPYYFKAMGYVPAIARH